MANKWYAAYEDDMSGEWTINGYRYKIISLMSYMACGIAGCMVIYSSYTLYRILMRTIYRTFISARFYHFTSCGSFGPLIGSLIGLFIIIRNRQYIQNIWYDAMRRLICARKKIIVAIEGNIGSGKTTMVKYLKENIDDMGIIFLQEPVDEWAEICDETGKTMLEKFYEDQKTNSFPFQIMAFTTRLSLMIKTLRDTRARIIIVERSLHTDREVFAKMLYDSKLIDCMSYKIYLKLADTTPSECMPDKMIYISTDPAICRQRIISRNRTGELNIEIEYLEKCMKYHDNMIYQTIRSTERLVLNGNIDCTNDRKQMDEWKNQIMEFISK